MSAVVKASKDAEESTGQPIWSLTLCCGHYVTCGRHSERPPSQRPCVTCKRREQWRRKDQRRRERKAAGLDTFVWRLRNA